MRGEPVGTGAAMAIRFAREGATIAIVDREPGYASRTHSLIESEGHASFVLEADVSREADCRSVAEQVARRAGRIDILVNNVGVADRHSVTSIDRDTWDHVLAVNLTSVMLMCRHVIPVMVEAGGGAIVNIASIAGSLPGGRSAYGTSKAGVIMLSREMAVTYGRAGIRVNVVAPGHVYAPMTADATEKARQRRRLVSLLGVEGTAWDVAGAALFLASDDSRFISGAVLPVDGGASQIQPLSALDLVAGVPGWI